MRSTTARWGLLALLCVLAAASGCKAREDKSSPSFSSSDEADQRALDRARKMERQGRVCNDGDPEKRDLRACRQACELGHSNSCGWLGQAHADGLGVTVDLERALERYREACTGGSGLGCEGVALATREVRYYREARVSYRVHCEHKHAVSCSRLARLYAEGLGGPAAAEVAITYRQHACALGRQDDCAKLR